MLATFFLGPQPFGPPKMSLVPRPPVAWSLILRTGSSSHQQQQQVHPLLLALLLPLVPHQVKEEKRVLVRVCQVAYCCLGDRTVHLHLTKQTKSGIGIDMPDVRTN